MSTNRRPPSALGIPNDEPEQPTAGGRRGLAQQIAEQQSSLQYMGRLHPKRPQAEQRLRALKTLLRQWQAQEAE